MLFVINWCFENLLQGKKNFNQSYAHPDKLTLELISAQLILQCLISKKKVHHHSKASK